jgi:hypothetical protein
VPHERNNYRAKLLHHKILLLFIALIFSSTFFLEVIKTRFPSVLGVQNNITVEQLISITNKKRADAGLLPLVLNPNLSQAAALKAGDMFAKDYWAHNSPDGTTPWVFIKQSGYNYVYAGENLARGFNSAEDVVNAWMSSPKHKENMLFKNYNDVGFAIKVGKLKGEDTILVVEEFGNQGTRAIATNKSNQNVATGSSRKVASPKVFAGTSFMEKPLLNSLSFSLTIDKVLLGIFIFTFILDMIIVERKRIARLVGHNVDHILFLVLIMLVVAVLGKGVII